MTDQEKSCWSCSYQQIGGDTFLGLCTYFSTVGNKNKEIPPEVVDKSCKYWTAKGARLK